MSTIPFNAQTNEEALSQYTQLSLSPDPNDKLLALGGLVRFIQNANHSFLLLCAKATDYQFLDRLIRNGMSVSMGCVDGIDVKLREEGQGDMGQLSQLGCAVVGVFAKIEEMRGQKEILDRIPSLISVLEQQNDHEVTDTLDTLQSLATIQPGADLILVPSSVSTLLKFIVSETNHLNDVLALLHTALEHAGPSVDALPVLKPLSQLFSTTKSPVVVNELSAFFTSQFASTPPPKYIHLSLYRGLKNLTMSKLDETARTNTVILLSFLLTQIGPTFLFSPPSTELNTKQMALLTVRLASAGCQTGFSRLESSTPQIEKQRLIADMDILHVTTAWLLSSEEDTLKIGSDFLTPDDILKVQETLSSAIREVSLYLRVKYDELRSSGQVTSYEEIVNPVIRTAVKFIGGWLGEGGSGQEEESLGLLEVLLALCSAGDVDVTTWSMRGIKGIILYTDNGATELLVSKDQLLKLLRVVVEKLSTREVSEETMIMIREICSVFRIMVDSQPLLITERTIILFPAELDECLRTDRVDEITWDARTEAALLGLEILLKIAEQEGNYDRQLMQKWMVKVKLLIRMQKNGEMREDLEFLAASLEKLNI